MKRLLIYLLKGVVAVAIYAAILWYSLSIADNPGPADNSNDRAD